MIIYFKKGKRKDNISNNGNSNHVAICFEYLQRTIDVCLSTVNKVIVVYLLI